jgi:type IV pilus assembly protein PilM
VALLLVGMTINYFMHYSSWKTADTKDPAMSQALSAATQVASTVSSLQSTHGSLATRFDEIVKIGDNLQSNVDGRLLWLELLKAIDAALPKDERPADQRKETPEDVAQRPELHIQSMECEFFPDVSTWHASILPYYEGARRGISAEAVEAKVVGEAAPAEGAPAESATGETSAEGAAAGETAPADQAATETPPAETPAPEPPAAPVADAAATTDPAVDPAAAGAIDPITGLPVEGAAAGGGLTGEGWIIEIRGYHFHNSLDEPKVDLRSNEGTQFVRNTFIKNLENGTVKLPDGPNGELVDVPISDLGIKFPVILTSSNIKKEIYLPEAVDESGDASMPTMPSAGYGRRGGEESGMLGAAGTATGEEEPKTWTLRRYDFLIQFCWQPTPRGDRLNKLAGEGETESAESPSTAAVDTDAAGTGDSS